MSYEFTKLSGVPAVAEFPEGANAIIETNGEIKRCPSSNTPKPLTYDYMPEGYPKKTLGTATLMEEQEVAFALEGGAAPGEGTAYGDIPALEIVEGKTYAVNWDGTAYECVCVALATALFFGNISILGSGDDTGEPFAYYCNYTEGASYFATLDTAASHTISVKTAEEIVTPMAEEFLPAVGGGVQPDWNQNDSTAADYVKNRPFYTGAPVETVLVEESTVPFAAEGGMYMGKLESTFSAIVGETYKASWDGTTYECACVDFSGMTVIGNLSIMGAGSDTGEPFIMAVNNGQGIGIYTADTASSHTISISGKAPQVVKINLKYLPILFKPKGKSYLTFSSPNEFTLEVFDKTKHWDGTLEYFASDDTWTTWDGTNALSSVYNAGEYVIYLRGTGNSVITGEKLTYCWNLTGSDIKCIGNIENLLDYATVESGSHPSMADYCYHAMFNGCSNLIQAPTLPATTLTKYCYSYMFFGCTSLTEAPTLPATTLAESCYATMFFGCTSLTKIPTLPATTLTKQCYYNMFYECTSLKFSTTQTDEYIHKYRIPSSGNGVTANNALTSMFHFTGGTFTENPEINTTYYLSSDNMIVRETKTATLNGYVNSVVDAAIENHECIIPSSTSGSTKEFKITVDDSGTISATEVT